MKRYALGLAQRGFAVFPLVARDKIPMIPKRDGGNGCLDATTDANQIETWWYRWPNANIGIAMRDILVVDLDGQEGLKTWSNLEREHGHIPTLAASTGTGGLHLYYTSRFGKNSARKVGPGIDTRGQNGYVVAPPSIHPNGTAYAWVNALEMQIVPDWILDAIARRDPTPTPTQPTNAGAALVELGNAYADRAWTEIIRRVETAADGTRNDQLNASAYSAGRLVASNLLSRHDAESGLMRAALTCGLGQHESEMTIASGLDAGSEIPVDLKPAVRTACSFKTPHFKTPRFYPPRAS